MTILAATDLSDASKAALKIAAHFADTLGEPLAVISVLEPWQGDPWVLLPEALGDLPEPTEESRKAVQDFVDATIQLDSIPRVEVNPRPAHAITEAAEQLEATMIVAGMTGHGRVGEAFFGSTVSALARRAQRPVLAVPPGEHEKIETILAPVDFSKCSTVALRHAADLADKFSARLLVHHSTGLPSVAPPVAYVPTSPRELMKAVDDRLDHTLESAGLKDRVDRHWVEFGAPHHNIVEAIADENVDLVVMGSHGRNAVERFFLGSISERMLRQRACPVLIVRSQD